ncbi:MAG: ERF family protein, partial [Pseudomonadota bacterium]
MNTDLVSQQAEAVTRELAATASTPMALIEMAVSGGADPDKLEKLMALQERWEANNARKDFFTAMAGFQSDCPEIPKNGEVYNKQGKLVYRFAKLEDIIKTIREAEHRHGFRHRWDQGDLENGGVRVACEITHVAGHTEASTVTIPPTKGMNTNAAQDRGIIIKYGKRYSLLNAYGLEPDDDTDARLPEPEQFINDNQANAIDELLSQCNPDDRTRFWVWLQLQPGQYDRIPASRFTEIVDKLRSKIGGD